jgi:hypothetical protein
MGAPAPRRRAKANAAWKVQNSRLSDAAALLGFYGKEIILQGLQYLSANWDSEKHRACLLHWLARVSVSDQWSVSNIR